VNDVPPPPPPSYGAVPPSGGSPDVGTALSYGFNKFFANWQAILGVILVAFAAELVFNLVSLGVSSFAGKLLFAIIGIVVNAVVAIGIYKTALMVTAGQTITMGEAFTYDRWGEWIIFSLVFGLMVGVGLVLCLIPGLVVLALFGMAPYFFIDRGMSLGDALTASREAATSRGFALPVLLSVIVGGLGVIACVVGALVTMPAAYIAVAYLYRNASGQPVAP
jgi:uncharacterized membrane protein